MALKLRYFTAILLVSSVFVGPPHVHAQSVTGCRALVQVGNDLWFATQTGQLATQVTRDGQLKTAVALSDNGKVIAYSGIPALQSIRLVDAGGRQLANFDAQTQDAIVGLEWTGRDILRVEEHINPQNSKYHFVTVPTAPFTAVKLIPELDSEGGVCARSPDLKDLACALGNSMYINNRAVYHMPDAVPQKNLQNVDIALGTNILTNTSPAFRIEVKSILNDVVQLRLTRADGFWTEKHVRSGDSIAMTFEQNDAEKPLAFSVLPQLDARNSGVIRINIRKASNSAVEAGPAWDLRGKRVAISEVDEQGNRTLVLLNRTLGSGALDGGAVDLRKALQIAGPVRRIEFPSDTILRVTGQTQQAELAIPAQGKVPAAASFSIAQTQPSQLSVKMGITETTLAVKGWACD